MNESQARSGPMPSVGLAGSDGNEPGGKGAICKVKKVKQRKAPANQTEKRYTISFNTIRRDDREHFQTIRDYRVEPHESSDPESKV